MQLGEVKLKFKTTVTTRTHINIPQIQRKSSVTNWSEDDLRLLVTMYNDGYTSKEIAAEIDNRHSPAACSSKLSKMRNDQDAMIDGATQALKSRKS